jgi:hypothetical protein
VQDLPQGIVHAMLINGGELSKSGRCCCFLETYYCHPEAHQLNSDARHGSSEMHSLHIRLDHVDYCQSMSLQSASSPGIEGARD